MNSRYLKPPVSNGNAREQALIRQWWSEEQGNRGHLVWEYYVQGYYIDAIWFPNSPNHGIESPGRATGTLFPIAGESIVVCEAKSKFIPELIGQALVYSQLLIRAGAKVERTLVLSEQRNPVLKAVAEELGLTVYETYAQQANGTDA